MDNGREYRHLETRAGSLYRQPFIKGTRIRVEIPYGYTLDGEDDEGGVVQGQSAQEVAAFLLVPVEAVLEAIDYCQRHWDVILADHARESRLMEVQGINQPQYKCNPSENYRFIADEERARIINDEDLSR